MSNTFNIEKFNAILTEYNQELHALKISGNEIILSNGLTLTLASEVRKCKRRVMFGASIWKENFDNLYNINEQVRKITESKCRKATSINGGKACQKKHSEKIKLNLNTNGKGPWNKSLKGTYPYSNPCSEETKQKISQANKGEKNGMFGVTMSDNDKLLRSKIMKDAILTGKFTPNSNNRNTHWDSYFKNKQYRSAWEALYQYFDKDAEYESIRIPYMYNGKEYIYIVDFVNHNTKKLIEIKPAELLKDKKTQAKIIAATQWCAEHLYEFVIADKSYFLKLGMPSQLNEFDKNTQRKIRNLYEACK